MGSISGLRRSHIMEITKAHDLQLLTSLTTTTEARVPQCPRAWSTQQEKAPQ